MNDPHESRVIGVSAATRKSVRTCSSKILSDFWNPIRCDLFGVPLGHVVLSKIIGHEVVPSENIGHEVVSSENIGHEVVPKIVPSENIGHEVIPNENIGHEVVPSENIGHEVVPSENIGHEIVHMSMRSFPMKILGTMSFP